MALDKYNKHSEFLLAFMEKVINSVSSEKYNLILEFQISKMTKSKFEAFIPNPVTELQAITNILNM